MNVRTRKIREVKRGYMEEKIMIFGRQEGRSIDKGSDLRRENVCVWWRETVVIVVSEFKKMAIMTVTRVYWPHAFLSVAGRDEILVVRVFGVELGAGWHSVDGGTPAVELGFPVLDAVLRRAVLLLLGCCEVDHFQVHGLCLRRVQLAGVRRARRRHCRRVRVVFERRVVELLHSVRSGAVLVRHCLLFICFSLGEYVHYLSTQLRESISISPTFTKYLSHFVHYATRHTNLQIREKWWCTWRVKQPPPNKVMKRGVSSAWGTVSGPGLYG